jgi:Glycosyl hydrolase family 26
MTAAYNLATHGMLDISIALGWEMDGRWYTWHAEAGSGRQADFVAAWRRIVTVMRRAQPSNNWKWVWNPTEHIWPNAAYLESIWPGNAFVDEVGVDCYDQINGAIDGSSSYYPAGSNRLERQQKVWAQQRGPRLKILSDFAASKGKPMSFPEWGLVTWKDGRRSGGGDNPYFIQKMHEFFMNPANNVVMQSYFNRNNDMLVHFIGDGSKFPQATARYKQLFGAGSD